MTEEELRLSKTRAALGAVSPTFCLAKWMQVTLYLKQGLTASCHNPPAHRIPLNGLSQDPSTLHNTPHKMQMRQELLQGLKPAECEHCWKMEDIGQTSDRIYKSSFDWAQPYMRPVLEAGAARGIDPSYMEVAFDSICNFKCMYCSPVHSSSWRQEIRAHGPYPTSQPYNQMSEAESILDSPKLDESDPYSAAFWQWWPELSQSLKVFRITGGEPLLIRDTWQVLERLQAEPRPQLVLSLNSNLGVSVDTIDRLIENINQLHGKIKRFILYVSIDTHGAQAEYLRYGLKFSRFMENSERILARTKNSMEFSYMVTANALSATGFTALLQDICQQKRRFTRHEIRVSTAYLRNPSFLALPILPSSFTPHLEQACAFMREQREDFNDEEINNVQRIVQLMKQSPLSPAQLARERADFRIMIEENDRRRGSEFLKVFPEYAEFWALCLSAPSI